MIHLSSAIKSIISSFEIGSKTGEVMSEQFFHMPVLDCLD